VAGAITDLRLAVRAAVLACAWAANEREADTRPIRATASPVAPPAAMTIRGAAARRGALVVAALVVALAAPATAQGPGAAGLRPGIWISSAELRKLPEHGPAWRRLVEIAHRHPGHPDLSNKDDEDDTNALAAALVAARTGDGDLRRKAGRLVAAAIGTERGGRTLGLGRGLVAYVVAADLIDLRRLDPQTDASFREWLRAVRLERLRPGSRPTLIATQEVAPNNWGTHAGASRIAADIYLGDVADLARAAAVFKGYLGDRAVYHAFRYGADLSWQAQPSQPVGVNAAGAVLDGQDVGGALPDDMRRGCARRFPPCPTGYPWEAMQGAVEQAEMLSRQGYDAWNWGDRALERAARFLTGISRRYDEPAFAPRGNDVWVAWLLNRRYGLRLPVSTPTRPGRGMGFTDWTAGPGSRCAPGSCAAPHGARRTVTPVIGGPIGLAARHRAERSRAVASMALFAGAGALGSLLGVKLLRRGSGR